MNYPKPIAKLMLLVALFRFVQFAESGCRIQERNSCETICQWNSTEQKYECNLRAIVILPKMDKVEASLPRVNNNFYFSFYSMCVCLRGYFHISPLLITIHTYTDDMISINFNN